jgi:hypothetical protein
MEKAKLLKLIDFVTEIANHKGNEWFKNELGARLNGISSKSDINEKLTVEIKNDTKKIINLLEISPNVSIDYSFIDHKLLRTRLELDNLRMENVRYDLKEKDEDKRLYDFCVNAFYQVENLINYFYHEKYSKFNNLLDHLESIDGTYFKRKDEKSISDITIATKIFAFTKTYYLSTEIHTGMDINALRLIRNEGLHRCTRIKNIENENKQLHNFLKYATFSSIHSIVNSLNLKVKNNLNK